MTDKRKTAEWVDVEEVHPWAGNPKKHTPQQVDVIAGLLTRFGFGKPLLARQENGELIAGHGTFAAALKLGMKRVLVRFMDLSEADAHQMAIADNASAELSQWDEAAIAAVAREQKLDAQALTGLALADDVVRRAVRSIAETPATGAQVEGDDAGRGPKRGTGAPAVTLHFTDEATRDAVKAAVAAEAEKGGKEAKEPSGDTLARLLGVLPRRRAGRKKAAA